MHILLLQFQMRNGPVSAIQLSSKAHAITVLF